MTKIVIIDEDAGFVSRMKSVLSIQRGFEVCGDGKDYYDILSLTKEWKPDVALIQFGVSGLDSSKLSALIKTRSPETKIIFITSREDEDVVLNLVRSGVPGSINRNEAEKQAAEACLSVKNGTPYIGAAVAVKAFCLLSDYVLKPAEKKENEVLAESPQKLIVLSAPELRVSACVGRGLSNIQIASELNLQEGTVRNYISSILGKAGLKNRTQIAIYAVSGKLCGPDKSEAKEKKARKKKAQREVRKTKDAGAGGAGYSVIF
ncbi:MAG: response regulator transcription factor [Spirochaetaceae bacterium]|jgi:DNA-binding NarL/FixJ family response regulator|nr:response regulator transcription factor [Spirochaetaceae bacterium]